MTVIGVLDRTGRLLDVVGRAVRRLDDSAEAVDLGPIEDLGRDTPFVDVLVLGPRELTPAGLARVDAWRRANRDSTALAVVARDGPASAELRAAGIPVRLRGQPTEDRLFTAFDRAYDVLDRRAAARQPAYDEPAYAEPAYAEPAYEEPVYAEPAYEEPVYAERRRGATVVTIGSATGGCGKTFFATNLAATLAGSGRQVLLLDLDLQFGEVAPALRLSHPYSVYDGLVDSRGATVSEIDLAARLDDLVVRHESGFDVLTAPRDPALADYVAGVDATRVIDVAADRYDVVVVDTPPTLNDVVLAAFDRSDVVAVLATLDVPSLRNLTVFLDVLRGRGIGDDVARLVLNKVEDGLGLSLAQAQEAFGGRFLAAIPQTRAASRSINTGTPLVRFEPDGAATRELRRAAMGCLPDLLGGLEVEQGAQDSVWARLRRLLRRR